MWTRVNYGFIRCDLYDAVGLVVDDVQTKSQSVRWFV